MTFATPQLMDKHTRQLPQHTTRLGRSTQTRQRNPRPHRNNRISCSMAVNGEVPVVGSWEYKAAKVHTMTGMFNEQTLTQVLNAEGEDQWELVAVVPVSYGAFDLIMFFKRPKA